MSGGQVDPLDAQRAALEAASALRVPSAPRDRLVASIDWAMRTGMQHWPIGLEDLRKVVDMINAASAVHDARLAGKLADGCAEWISYQQALQAICTPCRVHRGSAGKNGGV